MIKLKYLIETRIIDPESSLTTGDITLYHGTTWDTALKAKKGQLGPQNLKGMVVNVLVNDFGEDPSVAERYFDATAQFRKKDPAVLFLTPNFKVASDYAKSNTEWGGEVIADVLYNYIANKYEKGPPPPYHMLGSASYARNWIEQHRTKTPAVVTVTVPLKMVFTHPHWVTPAKNRILSALRSMRAHPQLYTKDDIKEIMTTFGEMFVYEPIPAKYVQRIDRV